MVRWIVTAMILLSAYQAQAAPYWDDEMENGSFTGVSGQFDPVPSGEQVVASPRFSGSGSLQYNYPDICHTNAGGGAQACGGATSRHFPTESAATETSGHFGRLYMRVSQNFCPTKFNFQSKLWGIRSLTGVNKFWINFKTGEGQCSLGMIVSAENTPNTGATTNIPLNYTMPREQWVCLEWEVERNNPIGTPTGVLRWWANGVQTVNLNNVQWTGATGNTSVGWDFVHMYRQGGGPIVTGQGEVAHLWFDRVAVAPRSNGRIGCVGIAPPQDPQPTPVQGFGVE